MEVISKAGDQGFNLLMDIKGASTDASRGVPSLITHSFPGSDLRSRVAPSTGHRTPSFHGLNCFQTLTACHLQLRQSSNTEPRDAGAFMAHECLIFVSGERGFLVNPPLFSLHSLLSLSCGSSLMKLSRTRTCKMSIHCSRAAAALVSVCLCTQTQCLASWKAVTFSSSLLLTRALCRHVLRHVSRRYEFVRLSD